MILAALAAATAGPACSPVPGAERLWASRATRYVMVGETHGTNEAPELFADLVCAASKKRPVVVALEQPPENKPAIEIFLKTNGGVNARTQFLKAPMWNQPTKDGRSSKAMLALFERLRELKQAGSIESVVPFDEYDFSVPFSNANEGVNSGMARALEKASESHPGTLLLAYSGSTHASTHNVGNSEVHSAAGRLPREQVTTVLISGDGGSAWNCSDAQCRGGVRYGLIGHASCIGKTREVVYPAAGASGFDAVACVGRPFTASPPAVPLASK